MLKKIISIIILFNMLSHCGFAPLYSNKTNVNFSISSIQFKGDRTINNLLKSNLNKYKNNNYDKKFEITVVSNYEKNILSKDKAANTTNYQLSLNSIFEIKYNDNKNKNLVFSEKKIMNNINDNFEERKNETIHKENFASSVFSKLVAELSMLNDI